MCGTFDTRQFDTLTVTTSSQEIYYICSKFSIHFIIFMAEQNLVEFRFIKSSRGGNKLEENGFMYDKQRALGNIIYWQCERRKECKARLHTEGMRIVKRINEHLHGPDMGKVTCLVTKAGLKRKAEQTQDTSQYIVAESVQNITEATATKLPKLNTLKRTIQRQRIKANLAPVQPENLAHLEIPMEYQRTSKNENFLLYDSGFEERRILIFGTKTYTEMLELAPIWLADGTFKTAPILFEQVYVIHALRGGPEPFENGHLLPILYC